MSSFMVIVTTRMYKVEKGKPVELTSVGTSTIGGFTTAHLAQTAAEKSSIMFLTAIGTGSSFK